MEVRVTDEDRNRIIQLLASENAELKTHIVALSRAITEMEMAQAAAEEKPAKKKS